MRALLWTPDQLAQLAEEQIVTRQQLLHHDRELHLEVQAEQRALRERLEELSDELNRVAAAANAIEAGVDHGHRRTATLGRSLAAIGEAVARIDAPDVDALDEGPLVSVVLPVRDRESVVGEAVQSVLDQTYPNWELLVVDDQSRDDSAGVVKRLVDGDTRVRLIAGAGRGAPAARNVALEQARGEIVTYIDSDNRWLPTYLAHVVTTYRAHPEIGSTVALQIVVDDRTRSWAMRDDDHPLADLQDLNFVDLNAYSHRRDLIDGLDGFDESLLRLSDWDLVRRFVAERPLTRIAVPGSVYRQGRDDQISNSAPFGWYAHLVRVKHLRPREHPLTVLCAEWHYPQLSETYVQADIEGLKQLGAHVEVWSEEQRTGAPFPSDEPIHRGELRDAIAEVRPHVVLTHWLNIGAQLSERIAETGVPMVVRGHGFEFTADRAAWLADQPNVRRIYVFPHFLAEVPDARDRIRSMPVGFDASRYTPSAEKDRSLVVRGGVAIPTKDYRTFFEVARTCREHRFVLCLVTAHRRERYLLEVVALRDELDAPVEIRVDAPHDEMSDLVKSAGIYLHTHNDQSPFGMPVSIAEAMATGCYVLAPDLPGCREYVARAGEVYTSAIEASALIRATVMWDDSIWRDVSNRAVDRAFSSFSNLRIAERMVADWEELGILASKDG